MGKIRAERWFLLKVEEQKMKAKVGCCERLSACPAYSGLADFALEKTLPLYFVDEKHLVGI